MNPREESESSSSNRLVFDSDLCRSARRIQVLVLKPCQQTERDKGAGVFVLASRTSIANPPSTNTGQLYDSNGDRTADANLPAGDKSERSSSNRLLFDGEFYYTYDAEGNRTAKYQLDENDEPVHVNRRYDGTAREPKWAGVEL